MTHKPSAKKSSKTQDKKEDKKKNKVHPNPEQVGTETKNLLLAVTGMSPAVVTETLYGIAQRRKAGDQNAYWPDAICILTTSVGQKKMTAGLFDDDWLQKVCVENGQPPIARDQCHIKVVPGANGEEVTDALSEADHKALANFITEEVRTYASAIGGDDKRAEWRIHASIAGGRKTMTFYLGYAMSLFGRHFDQMSHVLLETPEFEGARGFYAPTTESFEVKCGFGDNIEIRDAKNAKIVLTDIPFIRMRHSLPDLLKESPKEDETFNYQGLVDLINLGDQPELIRLRVQDGGKVVEVYSCAKPEQIARIENTSPVSIAMYMLILEDTCREAVCRNLYTRPPKGKDDPLLFGMLIDRLAEFMGYQDQVAGMKDFDALTYIYKARDEYSMEYPNLERSLESLLDAGTITSTKFTNLLSELTKPFRRVLPEHLADYVLPMPLFDKDGTSVNGSRLAGGAYGISLKPDQIKLVKD